MIGKQLALALSVAALVAVAEAAPKAIYAGWDLLAATPEEILLNADAFATAGCDGVAVRVHYTASSGRRVDGCRFLKGPALAWEDLAPKAPVLRKIVACEGLKASLLMVMGTPSVRLALSDDAGWATAAANFGLFARLAKEGGMDGLLVDFEDYRPSRQFFWDPEKDGIEYPEAVRRMRARGAAFFGAAFAAFPEMELVSFQLFANDYEYGVTERDPRRLMRQKRDLWPAFLNGMLDVLPPTARVTDGDENAYRYEAARHAFDRAASRQFTGVLPLVAPKNQAKYRAQMRVGFGLYLDGYVVGTNNSWYLPPVRGSRAAAFDDNLRAAARASDGYVWIYGERDAFIPWKVLPGTELARDWAKKPMWNETIPGFSDLVAGVFRPAQLVARRQAELAARGALVNLAAGRTVDTNGCFSAALPTPPTADVYYGVSFSCRPGAEPSAMVAWQGASRWLWGHESYADYVRGADGRTRGYVLARAPEGGVRLYLSIKRQDARDADPEIADVTVFRLNPDAAGGDRGNAGKKR